MTDCLLFDCDGTLVDSERLCNIGLVHKFKELGVLLEADELVLRFRGWKLALILENLATEHSVDLPKDFVPSYRSLVAELFESELKPIEGIEYALKNIPQPKAVVSSGPMQKIQQALRVTGLSKHFGENLYSSYDIGIWKPDPGVYRYASRDMGFNDDQCAVVDDGPIGVEAGCSAGMKTYFYNRFNESCSFPAAISFNSMHELPSIIEN
ncbi:MAG: haloacid dehalogenase [SAR86 cluster bacterium]|uniref:Haloacid dehalogenase n=1 Tax=SAR86 cluster bacterium TaxID=2030880 RepID=A0A2A4X8K8_9GAMM|nr:MAG: haloacid dehalogenase [SAR86 cluster bacterium]